jgi:hypothetical protein
MRTETRSKLIASLSLLAAASASALAVTASSTPAAAQFICVGNSTGAAVPAASADGAGANAAGSPSNVACGALPNASGGANSLNTAIGDIANASGGARARATSAAEIGDANTIYRLAGIPSAASLAAQVGPTSLVTTDANGNLAATPLAGVASAASVAALSNSVTGLQQYAIDSRREARQGIAGAMAMATAPLPSAPGRLTYIANGATFRGEFAAGGSIAYRLDTAHPLALTGGASIAGGGNIGVRAGIMGEL